MLRQFILLAFAVVFFASVSSEVVQKTTNDEKSGVIGEQIQSANDMTDESLETAEYGRGFGRGFRGGYGRGWGGGYGRGWGGYGRGWGGYGGGWYGGWGGGRRYRGFFWG